MRRKSLVVAIVSLIFSFVAIFLAFSTQGGLQKMTERIIQMAQRNAENTEVEQLYPITKAEIVTTANGSNMETELAGIASQFIVAASNAPASVKALAAYVCDGVDDDLTINQAIQSLPASGGEIQLSNGLFNLTNPIVIDRAVKLIGEGGGIAGIPTYTPTNGNTYENLYGVNLGITTIRCVADCIGIRIYNATNFKIKGLVFRDFLLQGYGKDRHTKEGFRFDVETDLCTIDNVSVTDCFVGLFSFIKAMDAPNIINSSFQWCGIGMIMKGTFGKIANCTIADCNGIGTYDGVGHNSGGAVIRGTSMYISNNTFMRCGRYALSETDEACGLKLSQLMNSTLHGNIIRETRGNGLYSHNSNFNVLTGNMVMDAGMADKTGHKYGIYTDGDSTYWLVNGNKIGKSFANIAAHMDYAFYSACTWGKHTLVNNLFYCITNSPQHFFAGNSGNAANNYAYTDAQ